MDHFNAPTPKGWPYLARLDAPLIIAAFGFAAGWFASPFWAGFTICALLAYAARNHTPLTIQIGLSRPGLRTVAMSILVLGLCLLAAFTSALLADWHDMTGYLAMTPAWVVSLIVEAQRYRVQRAAWLAQRAAMPEVMR